MRLGACAYARYLVMIETHVSTTYVFAVRVTLKLMGPFNAIEGLLISLFEKMFT